MTDDRDTERRIRAWLNESAPDRLPAGVRAALERETLVPSGSAGSGDARPGIAAARRTPFGQLDRLVQVAAAVGIVAIVVSTIAIYESSRDAAATPSAVSSAPATTRPSGTPTASAPAVRLGAPVALGSFWTSDVSMGVGSDGSVLVAGSRGQTQAPGAGATCNGDGIAIVDPEGARHNETSWAGWFDGVTRTAPFVAIATAADCSRVLVRSADGRTWQRLATSVPEDLAGPVALDWLTGARGASGGPAQQIVGAWSANGFRTLAVDASGSAWTARQDPPDAVVSSDTGDSYAIRAGRLSRIEGSATGSASVSTGLQLPSGWSPDAGLTGPVFRGRLLFRIPGAGGIGAAPIDGSGQVSPVFDAFSPDGYAVNVAYAAFVGMQDGRLVVAASFDGTNWVTRTIPDAQLPGQAAKFHATIAAAPGRIVVGVGTLSGNEELYGVSVDVSQPNVPATPAPSGTAGPSASATAPPAGRWATASLPSTTATSIGFSVFGLPRGGFVAFDPLGEARVEVLRSADGVTWSGSGAIPGGGWVHAFATDGTRSIAATGDGTSSTPSIWYSDDLANWSRATFDGTAQGSVDKIVAGPGGYLAIVGDGQYAPVSLWTSTDGATWTRSEGLAGGQVPFDVISVGGTYLLYAASAAGEVSIWTSADGTAWTAASGAAPFGSRGTTIVALKGELLACVSASGPAASTAVVWRSTDGIHWSGPSATDLPDPAGGAGLRFDSIGNRLLAVRPGGSSMKAWQSVDGSSWTSLDVPVPQGSPLDVSEAAFNDDGTTLVLSGSNTVHGPGRTAHSEPFVFALPVSALP